MLAAIDEECLESLIGSTKAMRLRLFLLHLLTETLYRKTSHLLNLSKVEQITKEKMIILWILYLLVFRVMSWLTNTLHQ